MTLARLWRPVQAYPPCRPSDLGATDAFEQTARLACQIADTPKILFRRVQQARTSQRMKHFLWLEECILGRGNPDY